MKNSASSFYDQLSFQSERFVTDLYPPTFLLFFCMNQGVKISSELNKLCIVTKLPEDPDESKLYLIFNLTNDSIKESPFCFYAQTGANIHQVTYRRIFNRHFASAGYLQLMAVFDNIASGRASDAELDFLLKKQIADALVGFKKNPISAKNIEIAGIHESFFQPFNPEERQKIISYYKQSCNNIITAPALRELIRNVFFIDAEISFKNRLLETNYHPGGLGLDEVNYRFGKIVLDSYVKYSHVLADINFNPLNETEFSFNRKVDYISLININNSDGSLKDVLIPLANSTQDNYLSYILNGLNVQFPSCIYAYTLQLVKGKLELHYKVQNSNNYFSESISHGEEISLHHPLYYKLSDASGLVFSKPDESPCIIATHTVKIRVYHSSDNYRIETEEKALINVAQLYQTFLKNLLIRKINALLDVFLPAIYERKIDLG